MNIIFYMFCSEPVIASKFSCDRAHSQQKAYNSRASKSALPSHQAPGKYYNAKTYEDVSDVGDNQYSQQIRNRDELDVSLDHETQHTRRSRSDHHGNGHRHSPWADTHCYHTDKSTTLAAPPLSKSTPDLQEVACVDLANKNDLPSYGETDSSSHGHRHCQRSKSVPRIQVFPQNHRSLSEEKCIRDKEGKTLEELSSPIRTIRLRTIRQKTRNVVVNILDDGYVCLEFIKLKDNQEKVLEVFRISPDGSSVSSIFGSIVENPSYVKLSIL